MGRRDRCGVGISVHTGWAACVVVRGSLREPEIAAREEIELLGDPDRFLFHRAAKMKPAEAEKMIAKLRKAAAKRAIEAIDRLAGDSGARCAIVASDGETSESLEEIVASHARIHSAEGCFYRDVWRSAVEEAGLEVEIVPPKKLGTIAARALELPAAEIDALIAAAGKIAGRPWAKDQKLAALAAWTVLG